MLRFSLCLVLVLAGSAAALGRTRHHKGAAAAAGELGPADASHLADADRDDFADEQPASHVHILPEEEEEERPEQSFVDAFWDFVESVPKGPNAPVKRFCKSKAEQEKGQSALVALLLAIFMGWTGAPRFYYGYYATGGIHLALIIGPLVTLFGFVCCAGACGQLKAHAAGYRQARDSDDGNPGEGEEEDLEQLQLKNPLSLGVGLCCLCCLSTLMIAAAAIWSFVDIILVANYTLFPQHGACLVRF